MAEFAKAGWLVGVEHGDMYRWFLVGSLTDEGAKNAVRVNLGPGLGNRRVHVERKLEPEELAGHKLKVGQVSQFGRPTPRPNK
jgi:hypothetical protein